MSLRLARSTPAAFALSLLLAWWPAFGQVGGGGLMLYEQGTRDQGASAAGAGARAQDAGTVYTNPAGMTWLERCEVLVGLQAAYLDMRLHLDNASTVSALPAGSSEGGGQAGGFLPGGGLYFARPLEKTNKLWFGLAVNAPYGGAANYGTDWVGRRFVTENFMIVTNIEPALAYRLFDWLSVGAGLNIHYFYLTQQFRLGVPAADREISGDDWDLGFTVGGIIEPRKGTRVGVTYKSATHYDLEGDFRGPAATVEFNAALKLPQGVNVSLYHELTPKLALLADVGWTDWSEFSNIKASAGTLAVAANRGWKDTYRVAGGLQYKITDRWLVRGGYSFDGSPVSGSDRLPDIPVGEAHRFSAGVEHQVTENTTLGLSYTFVYFGQGNVDTIPVGPTVLDGEINPNIGHFVALTIGHRW